MLDGCGTDSEGSVVKLPFFFLLSTVFTAALSMRRIIRFWELGTTKRRLKQIDTLIDYKFAEAELYIQNYEEL